MSTEARGQTQSVRHVIDFETLGILACPLCGGRLRNTVDGLICPADGATFPTHPSGLLDLRPPDGRAAADAFAAQYRAGRLADGWQPLSPEVALCPARRRSARVHAALLDGAPGELGGAGQAAWRISDCPSWRGRHKQRRKYPGGAPELVEGCGAAAAQGRIPFGLAQGGPRRAQDARRFKADGHAGRGATADENVAQAAGLSSRRSRQSGGLRYRAIFRADGHAASAATADENASHQLWPVSDRARRGSVGDRPQPERAIFRAAPLTIADLGAGFPWLSHRLASLGHAVLAVDLSPDADFGLGAARLFPTAAQWGDPTGLSRLRGGFLPALGDLERPPLAQETYDVVICNASLHYAADLCVRRCSPGADIAIRGRARDRGFAHPRCIASWQGRRSRAGACLGGGCAAQCGPHGGLAPRASRLAVAAPPAQEPIAAPARF